ncbi:MAG: alpha/beta hydrolase family protein, partial [Pseudomonadota bacterium]
PGTAYADYMLSANIGGTIQSVRQAVLDGRKLIAWLKTEGYGEISVLGLSLGSWVAGLVAAHDENVSKASLFMTAGSLADMVWTGRATEAIRQSLENDMELSDLRQAWGPIDQENYARRLARPGLELQLVLAKRDTVVVPELSHKFVQTLQEAGASPDVLQLNCGHYSLALPPHIFFAGLRLRRLLKGR